MTSLPEDPRSELVLVEQCVQGEATAREAFAVSYMPVIRGAVRQVIGPGRSEAGDVENTVQQVFLELLKDGARKLGTFDGRSRLSTWITVVAARYALNAIAADPVRRLGREKDRGLVDALAHRGRQDASPPDEVARREERLQVNGILDRMPERDRLLLKLVHEDGGTYAEAARVLGVSPNSISSLLERARSRFLDLARAHAPDLVRPHPSR